MQKCVTFGFREYFHCTTSAYFLFIHLELLCFNFFILFFRDEEEVAMECEKARKASVMAAREAAKRRKRLRTSSNSSNGSGGSASTSTSSSSTPGKARRLLMDMPLPASASQGIRRPSASRSSSQRSQGSQRGRSKSLERLRLQAALRGNNYQGYRVVLSA